VTAGGDESENGGNKKTGQRRRIVFNGRQMSSTALDFRNTNSLWCSVVVETLARLGLRHAVVCPGSRSAPLTFAFARHPQIEAISVLDERSGAFFALGLVRQHHRPVALVCTSGTAAANFLPAIIEAHESSVPLLVFTADRPPEMRECGSGQAIDQQKLYGGYVNDYHELAVPETRLERLQCARQTVVQAFERTLFPVAGPVHLNAPFRDPLPPVEDGQTEEVRKKIDPETFFSHLGPVMADGSNGVSRGGDPAFQRFGRSLRGVIVAGPAQPADPVAYCKAVARISAALGWPVLADGLNPLRNHAAQNPRLVVNYNAVLHSAAVAARLKPEAVLGLGDWPTSKQLRQWLQGADAETRIIAADSRNHDPLHGRTRHLRCSVEAFAAGLPASNREPAAYAGDWLRADQAAGKALDAQLSALDCFFEGYASRLLSQFLPSDTPVFVASSMPVRDVEFFWGPGDRGCRPCFNRGANGIDGTLSTALGVAHGNKPAVLLTGDLALLHDTNGFLLRPKLRGSLTIVLLNNHGGGIFEMLPVAKFDPPFEEFFATPQEADFGKLCSAYGAEHVLVRDREHFTKLVSALPATGLRVLEVQTDRKRDAVLRRELFTAAAQAAENALTQT
jgi:2-succinyl-5-enolpyruvyl-6-hydroxy-3-cyclohexene-1-carboxylate synthase